MLTMHKIYLHVRLKYHSLVLLPRGVRIYVTPHTSILNRPLVVGVDLHVHLRLSYSESHLCLFKCLSNYIPLFIQHLY